MSDNCRLGQGIGSNIVTENCINSSPAWAAPTCTLRQPGHMGRVSCTSVRPTSRRDGSPESSRALWVNIETPPIMTGTFPNSAETSSTHVSKSSFIDLATGSVSALGQP
eukprot:157949-Karenia_brevis.AAC.1